MGLVTRKQVRSCRAPHAPRIEQSTTAVCWVLAALMAVVAVIRASSAELHRWLIGAQGIAGWLLLPAHPIAAWAVRRRYRGLAVFTAVLGVGDLWLAMRARGQDHPDQMPPGSTQLRVLTANLLRDNPDIENLGRDLLRSDADVIALQELTPDHVVELNRCGLIGAYPHHVIDPSVSFHGSALLSRLPIAGGTVIDVDGYPMTEADIITGGGPIRVVSVHVVNPAATGQLRTWSRQLASLARYAERCPVPLILAGDFNATLDHRSLRDLLETGLRDAFQVAGQGFGLTWPRWRRPMVALMRLDHVLVSRRVAVGHTRTEISRGSDHKRLTVDLAVVTSAAVTSVGR